MNKIETLANKLGLVSEPQEISEDARVPSGIVIDFTILNNSRVSIAFFVLGVCTRIANEYGLESCDYSGFLAEVKHAGIDQTLEICRNWFGLVYKNEHNE